MRRRSRHGERFSEVALRRSLAPSLEKDESSVREDVAVIFIKPTGSAIAIGINVMDEAYHICIRELHRSFEARGIFHGGRKDGLDGQVANISFRLEDASLGRGWRADGSREE